MNANQGSISTISRVCDGTIIELVFDHERRKTGLVVSRYGGLWNIEQETQIATGEVLVPYAATNNLIASGCILLPSKPEHHGSKEELVSDIKAYLSRYVDMSIDFADIAARYVLLSWVHDAFNEMSYLRFRGDYGTGKTRALLAVGSICYRPFFASGASTVSPIFHILDAFGGTLVLDEADLRFSDKTSDLVKILNNGTMRGLPVLRTMQNRNKELDPRAFRVFGPKLVAMRGVYSDEALESRFLTEDMNKRSHQPNIPFNIPPEFHAEGLALRNKLLHFRLCTLAETHVNEAVAVEGMEPRLNQIMLPLLSVIEDAALRARVCEVVASSRRRSSAGRDKRTLEAMREAIRGALSDGGESVIPLSDIASRTNARLYIEPELSTRTIGFIARKRLGLHPYKSNGVYVLSRASLSEFTSEPE